MLNYRHIPIEHVANHAGYQTFQDYGVRKLTLVDSGRIVMSKRALATRRSGRTSSDARGRDASP
jgi:hypothetical protein